MARVLDVIGAGEPGSVNGAFDRATFRTPQGLALSADGATLYVADTGNHLIRAIDLNARTVKTAAGTGQQARGPSDGGAASSTSLSSPWDLAMHGPLLFIAMAGAHQIWMLDAMRGLIWPYAGSGREARVDGTVDDAAFAQPSGLTIAERDDVRGGQRIEHHPRDRAAAGQSCERRWRAATCSTSATRTARATPSASSIRSASRITAAASTSPTPTTTASSASTRARAASRRFAGTGRPGHQDGPAAKAQFYEPAA